MSTLRYGKIRWSHEEFDPKEACRPNPILTFNPVRVQGRMRTPLFGDRNAIHILKHKTPLQVLFPMAYSKWINTGASNLESLGEGRALLKWLQNNKISIAWRSVDFKPHPYFCQSDSPIHDSNDEMAQGLSFAIKPVEVDGRKVKLYLQDDAMLSLLSLPYGMDVDFLELVMKYVSQRFLWAKWRAPAPPFADWVHNQALRPVFNKGQLGFSPTF